MGQSVRHDNWLITAVTMNFNGHYIYHGGIFIKCIIISLGYYNFFPSSFFRHSSSSITGWFPSQSIVVYATISLSLSLSAWWALEETMYSGKRSVTEGIACSLQRRREITHAFTEQIQLAMVAWIWLFLQDKCELQWRTWSPLRRWGPRSVRYMYNARIYL